MMRTTTARIRAVVISAIGIAAVTVAAVCHAETMQTREEHLNEKLYGSIGLERAFERD